MSTVVGADTTFGMRLKLRDGEPEKLGTMIVAGTGAMSGRLLDRRTVASLENGAMSVSVTFADETVPQAIVGGVSVRSERATAMLLMVTSLFAVLGSVSVVRTE